MGTSVRGTGKIFKWLCADAKNFGGKRYMVLFRAALMAALPFLCCLVHCKMQGRGMGDVWLASSEWNDELFYFKQVEGIVKFGFPQGYFGFNESHAIKLSFAAWSPVLVFPWIIWGILFGWNFMSPIICNIFLMTMAVFLFMCLVRPTWKQTGVLAFLFCLYTPFVRYMLSGMPEVICFSLLIIFYGIAVNYLYEEKGFKLAVLFVLSGLLTLMRPYMLLFLLLPVFLWYKKSGLKGLAGSGVVTFLVLLVYALIKKYFGAEYFAPLFFTDWITTFFTQGIGAGIHNFFGTLYYMGRGFLADMIQGFRTGLASGAFFGGYTVMMAVLLYQTFFDALKLKYIRLATLQGREGFDPHGIRQTDADAFAGLIARGNKEHGALKNRLIIQAHLTVCFVGMLFALLLMYKLTEGSKHLLTFMAVGIFVVSLMETKTFKKAVLIGAVFAYLYSYMAVEPYDYQIPFVDEKEEEQLAFWRESFDAGLSLEPDDVPNYENVIIWTFNDYVDGNVVNTKWQLLYALPEGMGISCCTREYVEEHFNDLHCRYIALVTGGDLDKMFGDAGCMLIDSDGDMSVYEVKFMNR